MDVVSALGKFELGVPLVVLFGSLVFSSLLRIPPLVAIVGAIAPLALPYMELPPLAQEWAGDNPQHLVLAGWGAMLILAVAWIAIRPVIAGSSGQVSLSRLCYRGMLVTALVVCVLRIFYPGVLTDYAPQWRGVIGGALLAAAMVCMSTAFARMLKAGFALVLWACVTSVLASELLWQKLPHTVSRGDLQKLPDILAAGSGGSLAARVRRMVPFGGRMVGTVMGLARTDLAGGGAVFDSLVGQVSDSSQPSAGGATAPPGDVDLEV
jgi:hypothetical protein